MLFLNYHLIILLMQKSPRISLFTFILSKPCRPHDSLLIRVVVVNFSIEASHDWSHLYLVFEAGIKKTVFLPLPQSCIGLKVNLYN